MFKLFDKKSVNDTFIIIDVGTENIKVAVSKLVDGVQNVIGYAKARQAPNAMNGAIIINVDKVKDSLDKALGEALTIAKESNNFKIPKSAIFGTAGELVKGNSVIVNVERAEENELITEVELEETIENVKKHSFSASLNEVSQKIGLNPSQVHEISTIISSTKVDGYLVDNPVGMKAKNISHRVFSTFAPKIQLNSIYSLAEHLKLNVDKIFVEPYALAKSVSRNVSSNAIIIDVGGGTTDIALIKDNEFIGTQMFAIGGRTFTKRIQNDFDLSFEEAEDYKIAYSTKQLDSSDHKEIYSSLRKDIKIWLKGVEFALSEFEDIKEFPTKMYLCGGGTLLPEIVEGILEYGWKSSLKFSVHPKVEFLEPNKIIDVIDKTGLAIDTSDIAPLALTHMLTV